MMTNDNYSNDEYVPIPIEETERIMEEQRNEIKKTIEEKLSHVPIDDINKNKLVDLVMCFYDQHHSGFSASYALSNIFYFLHNNNSLDEIEYILYTKHVDTYNALNSDVEELDMQRLITNNVKEIVAKAKEILDSNEQYKEFYIILIRNLLFQKPLFGYVTLEDDKWVEWSNTTKETSLIYYSHKDSNQLIKIVDPETNEVQIKQVDYYIFEDKNGNTYTTDISSIDIKDCYAWSVDSVDIDIDIVQKFVTHYNNHGVLFDQSEYNEDNDITMED